MKRNRPNVLRLVVNLVCFALAAIIIFLVMISGVFESIKHAIPMYIGLVAFLGGFPAIMAIGNRMIKKQDEIISIQLLHNAPVNFSKRSVIFGYVLMFLPLYIFILAIIMIPYNIWIAFFIPICVFTFVIVKMKEPMLHTFKLSVKKYRLIHFAAFLFCVILGAILRILVIAPLVKEMM